MAIWASMIPTNYAKKYSELEQVCRELENLSGYSIDTLRELFAAGYTLKPPEPPVSLEDMIKEVQDD